MASGPAATTGTGARMASIASSLWTSYGAANAPSGPADLALTLGAALLAVGLLWWGSRKWRSAPLPPGPRGLPLLGVLPFLEPQLHRLFAAWARRFGPVMSFRLGSRLCVVLSSASTVEEVASHYDVPFADRDVPAAVPPVTYGGIDLAFAPYGPVWRTMRKVSVQEVLNRKNLDNVSWLRRRVVRRLVRDVRASTGNPVDLGELVFLMAVDMMTNMLWGGSMEEGADRGSIGKEFREVVDKMNYEVSTPNVSDLFPVLAPLDLQGVERRMKECAKWYDRVAEKIIKPRLEAAGSGGGGDGASRDFLDVMLDIVRRGETEVPFTLDHVKALLLSLVVAGSETTSTSVEWTTAELMCNPEALRRVKEELDSVVGKDKTVEESHVDKLPYLAAAVRETMRLHPPLPFLFPRCPSQSCTVGGYHIPKGTRVFVNAWAIHREPGVWEDPEEFKPERFFSTTEGGGGVSTKSSSYIPFGFGRRICVGLHLGEKMVIYTLASLLHSFEWQTKEGEKVDLSDKFGSAMKKAKPLVLVPAPRLSDDSLYA